MIAATRHSAPSAYQISKVVQSAEKYSVTYVIRMCSVNATHVAISCATNIRILPPPHVEAAKGCSARVAENSPLNVAPAMSNTAQNVIRSLILVVYAKNARLAVPTCSGAADAISTLARVAERWLNVAVGSLLSMKQQDPLRLPVLVSFIIPTPS